MLHRRRSLFASLACFVVCLSTLAPAAAADASFVRLWPGWRETDSFDRIKEFLGGNEPTGGRSLLRTQPASRAGYYFLLRVKTTTALTAGAKFELAVLRPDAPEPKTFSFPVVAPAGETVFDLGLTGADWPGGKKTNPVAWKLTLLSADGRVLAEHKSFLWEKPAK
jgi:hypothetical protein